MGRKPFKSAEEKMQMALYSLWPHLDDNNRVPGLSNSWK